MPTLTEELEELRAAWRQLLLTLANALELPRLLDWLEHRRRP